MSPTGGGYEVVVTATITNIGGATANSIFVRFESTSGDDTGIIASLAPGASHDVDFTLTFSANQVPDCPLDFTVEVDPYHTITECREDNNIVEGSVACPRCT
jgi:subtilase family serine protease